MEKKFKLGVIGAGFMSYSIVRGALNSGFLKSNDITVSDINKNALEKFGVLGVNLAADNGEIVANSEFVLFAVKPQHFTDAVKGIVFNDNKLISIMAGVKKSSIKKVIGSANIPVVRCMPNTPCSVGNGAVGIDVSDFSDVDKQFAIGLFSSFAEIALVDESKLNAVTGISGSSPAYFYLFIKHIIDAGVKAGLSFEDAKKLAVNTMIGSGKMLLENKTSSIDDLISAVCSKGGTTIEAINVFNNSDISAVIEDAIDKCVKRAAEIEASI